MNETYKIRPARAEDMEQVRDMVRQYVALEKHCQNPEQVTSSYMEEFVDKALVKGHMLVIENQLMEMKMIGQVHHYQTNGNPNQGFSELHFIPRMSAEKQEAGTNLVEWLFKEVQEKHRDVFRVALTIPLNNDDTVEHFKTMGIHMNASQKGRFRANGGVSVSVIPFSWMNPAFN